MIIFENLNTPTQPQKGIYAWYAEKDGRTLTIYIGQAGLKDICLPKGTLFRGISELQRNTFSSNSPKYDVIDTDFIVGTAVKYFDEKDYKCVWKHISNDPKNEHAFVFKEKPILQNVNANIIDKFKRIKSSTGRWKLTQDLVHEAENKIFRQLSELEL